ncbi:SMP-30/gluconolactonase/LRE family protein [soil metagenome]
MKVSTADLLVDNRAAHGEGPVWKDDILYWVDLTACRLHTWTPGDRAVRDFQFAEPVCAVAPLAGGYALIAFAKRLARVNLTDLSREEICPVEPDLPDNRCNDGKPDPSGRFWVGTMSVDGSVEGAGSLYRLDDGARLTRVLDHLTIPNGMGWSPDHGTMYFIDSPTREIWAFDFDPEDSSITDRRTVVGVPDGLGIPDGMTVGADGTLWVAHWGAGCICQWCPRSGELLHRIDTGCPHTSSCCFGGEDGRRLFITTSRLGLDTPTPSSGSLFQINPLDEPISIQSLTL